MNFFGRAVALFEKKKGIYTCGISMGVILVLNFVSMGSGIVLVNLNVV